MKRNIEHAEKRFQISQTSLARILTFHTSLFSFTFSFSILYTHRHTPCQMMLVAMLLTPLSYRMGSCSPCLLSPDLPPKEKIYAASTQDFSYLVSVVLVSRAADCPAWQDTINSPMLLTACCVDSEADVNTLLCAKITSHRNIWCLCSDVLRVATTGGRRHRREK